MLDHLRVVVRRDERLAFAAVGHRQPADEVGQPDVRRALLLRVLVEVVVELPRLVADPEVVLLIAHEIVEDHEVREQDLVHPPDRLEAVQVVLGALALDVLRLVREQRARGMDPLPTRLEHGGDRVLREPVELEIGVELSELVRDRDVAPRMAEPDRRGDVEGALAPRLAANPAWGGARRGDELAQKEIDRDRVAHVREVPGTFQQRRARLRSARQALTPRVSRGDRVLLAVDHEHGAPNAAAEARATPPRESDPARRESRRASRRPSRAPSRRRPRSASSSAAR